MDELLTTGQVAARCGLSRSQVWRLCENELLPYTMIGGRRIVRAADLDCIALRPRRGKYTRVSVAENLPAG